MRIRFLDVWASASPEFPFRAGQVIDIDTPTASMLAALDAGKAEALRDDEPEMAVVGGGEEKAVIRRPRKRDA